MALIEYGKVQDGSILLSKPLPLPEGTEVVIHVEPINIARQSTTSDERDNFTALPLWN